MSGSTVEPTRTWAGSTMDERRTARREQLIEAGLDLIGNGGTTSVTVRAACRKAGLTQRYFYESFADRDDLVTSVFETVAEEASLAIIAATTNCSPDPVSVARAAVEAVMIMLDDDPRKGRVLFVAPMTDEALYAKRSELAPVVTALVRDQLDSRATDEERDLVAVSLVGATSYMFFEYLTGRLKVSRDALAEHCVRLLLSGGSMHRR